MSYHTHACKNHHVTSHVIALTHALTQSPEYRGLKTSSTSSTACVIFVEAVSTFGYDIWNDSVKIVYLAHPRQHAEITIP